MLIMMLKLRIERQKSKNLVRRRIEKRKSCQINTSILIDIIWMKKTCYKYSIYCFKMKRVFIIVLTKGGLRVMGSRDGSRSKVSDKNIENKTTLR